MGFAWVKGFLCFFLCLGICHAELNITDATTFEDLREAIVDLGFPKIDPSKIAARIASPFNSSCTKACSMLWEILPTKVALPDSDVYQAGQIYWANQQAETLPTCRVNPTEAVDISATLLILEFTRCQFAVKSGGHASYAGGSNIQDGVTIDMKGFRKVELSPDKSLATVGSGIQSGQAADVLTPLGYAVTAGRVYDVGVGGFTLGGGISFVTNRHGLALDNVAIYEVVLASGKIVNASETSNPDLYWALRGGGNNFGVVTNFHYYAYPIQPSFWGGYYINNISQRGDVFKAFEDFVLDEQDEDLDAQYILATSTGQILSILTHAAGNANATAFKDVLAIPPVYSSLAVQTLDSFVRFMGASDPYGYRELFITVTIKIDASLIESCHDILVEEFAELNKTITISAPWMSYQSFSKNMIRHMTARGGNPTGLADTATDGRLININMQLTYPNQADDTLVHTAATRIFSRCSDIAKSRNLYHPYIYQNYGAKGQKVFEGYGRENLERLRSISKRYDPRGYFQWLQPGYFKLKG